MADTIQITINPPNKSPEVLECKVKKVEKLPEPIDPLREKKYQKKIYQSLTLGTGLVSLFNDKGGFASGYQTEISLGVIFKNTDFFAFKPALFFNATHLKNVLPIDKSPGTPNVQVDIDSMGPAFYSLGAGFEFFLKINDHLSFKPSFYPAGGWSSNPPEFNFNFQVGAAVCLFGDIICSGLNYSLKQMVHDYPAVRIEDHAPMTGRYVAYLHGIGTMLSVDLLKLAYK